MVTKGMYFQIAGYVFVFVYYFHLVLGSLCLFVFRDRIGNRVLEGVYKFVAWRRRYGRKLPQPFLKWAGGKGRLL